LRTVEPPIANIGFTMPRCAMPPEYKISGDSVDNYRAYYREGKKHILQYRKRHSPHFL
jgi:hypothetical protein